MPRLQRASERALIAHTMIDLVRTVFRGRLQTRLEKADIDTLLIAADVLIGHVEQRPRNASDVARRLQIPRPTVIRKLSMLERTGVIKRIENGRYQTVNDDPEASLGYVDTSLSIIRRAARR